MMGLWIEREITRLSVVIYDDEEENFHFGRSCNNEEGYENL
jgi:hypothetical protein